MANQSPLSKIESGMKVTAQMSPEPSEADLQLAKTDGCRICRPLDER